MTPLDSYRAACTQVVQAAKDRLSLADVWDLAPHCGQEPPPARGLGVVKSPLRVDRSPSFSVFAGGRAFCDKARENEKGGVWEFVALARPELDSAGIARLLVERAGLQWPVVPKRSASAGAEPPPEAPVTPEDAAAQARLLKEQRLAKQKEEAAARDRAERRRRAARVGVVLGDNALRSAASAAVQWPACVEARWADGVQYREDRPDVVDALCTRRGWPSRWADGLCGLDLVAFPVEARYEIGGEKARRMVAFKVEAPTSPVREASGVVPVGYHQKFYNIEAGRSGWQFFPSRPKSLGAWSSSYQRAMEAEAVARKVPVGESWTAPLPFVVGQVKKPRLVIITEGQWDALTVYGALGGLCLDFEAAPGVLCMGVRGIKGTSALLAAWGPWLRAVRPAVWLMPDNDTEKTGAAWYPPARAVERVAGKVYFSEQLAFAGARKVVVTPLRVGTGGKDFNDYFRESKPSTVAMWEWVAQLGLLA